MKYFTLEQAESILPEVQALILKLQALEQKIMLLESIEIEIEADNEDFELPSMNLLNKQFHRLSYQFYLTLEKLEKQGCLLKDLELGLVDFYCCLARRDVFLCWQLGEAKISYWHDIDDGYSGRRKIIDFMEKHSKRE